MLQPTDLSEYDQATIEYLMRRFDDLREQVTVRCESSRETSLALTNLDQAVMWMSASIGMHGAS